MPMRKEESTQSIYEQVDAIYRSESRRVFATLIRLLGDFDLAEEAVQTAFAAALEQWPRERVPTNPRAWLVSTGRFKAIDALRRRARLNSSIMESMGQLEASPDPIDTDKPEKFPKQEFLASSITEWREFLCRGLRRRRRRTNQLDTQC